MVNSDKQRYTKTEYIVSEMDVARVTTEANRVALDLGFSKSDTSLIATSVKELAQNVLKYAKRGYITISIVQSNKPGIEIIAHDQGPGIEDIDAAMSDHYSTGGTMGIGLPGVKRMMDEFLIDTAPGQGTKIVVKKWL